jgi:hypothetical protein
LLLVIAFSTLELVIAEVRVEFGHRRRDLFIHPSIPCICAEFYRRLLPPL